MKVLHSEIATAMAALALVTIFLAVPGHCVKAANAIPDLPTVLDQARTVHLKGQQYFPGQRQENGSPIPPVEMETWIDKPTGRTRQTQTGMSQRSQMSSQGGAGTTTTVTVTEVICDGTYEMRVNHTAKTVRFSRVSDYYRELAACRLSQGIWSQICGQAAPLERFTKVGRETIDGHPCDIWQLDTAHTLGDGSGGIMRAGGVLSGSGRGPRGAFPGPPSYSTRSKLWLSADDGRLVRAQASSHMQGGSWELQSDYQTIECNVEIPPGVFATEPPTGYTAKNSKAGAPTVDLQRGLASFNANGFGVEFGVLAAFVLNDGSVIAGWQSRERPNEGSQEPFFAGLTVGGPLPKLPVEIYGLRTMGRASNITYIGHHLTSTCKANRFTEWGLYVPSTPPPAAVNQTGYDALYRFNIAAPANAQFGLGTQHAIPIKTAEDFDKWVRGAMAELSDNAAAPADVTYQKVIDLARQIHASGKP